MRRISKAVWFAAAGLMICYGVAAGADFNGDGTDDFAIYRSNGGLWGVRDITRVYLGNNDAAVPGDYNGDGTDDFAVYRPLEGRWAVRDLTRIYFGTAGDEAIASPGPLFHWDFTPAGSIFAGTPMGAGPGFMFFSPNGNRRQINATNNGISLLTSINSGAPSNTNGLTVSETGNVGIGMAPWAGPRLVVDGQILLHDYYQFAFSANHSGILSSNGKLWAIDATGNFTQITPNFRETGEWIYYCKNVKTGRVVRVNMEKLVRKMEEITGEKFMEESWEEPAKIKADGTATVCLDPR